MSKELTFNKTWIPRRADPYVYRHTDGSYYFTASVPAYDRIVLRKSDTLGGLAESEEKTLWFCHETGPQSKHIWAPELHHVFGGWYIYYSGGEKDDPWKIRPYVLRCLGDDPMEDSWEELGMLKAHEDDEFSFRAFSLDTTVFQSGGAYYCIWAEKVGVGRQISNLYIARLKDASTLDTVQVLLTTPDYDWERYGFWVNEGPAVIKRSGKIYVTYSASDTGVNYCMGMLTADENSDLLDPLSWKKERYPVLKTDWDKGIYGPGHNSFTTDENGNDILVFHARTEAEIVGDPLYNPNRHAMLQPIRWTEDSKPVFSFDNDSF